MNLALFLIFLIKISACIKNRQVIKGKTSTYRKLSNDYKLNNDNANLNINLEKNSKVLPLEDNIPCIANYTTIIKQGIAT